MAGGKLSVEIGADKTDFDKKIKEVEFDIKELSKVKLDKLKLGLDTTEINSQIKDAKNTLNQLKTTVKDTGQAFTGMAPKVANGGNALMQFSRIAQDAPFGIIGIGNNITATVEAFGHLKKETGSTGGALKALAGSIMGSGGVLLGVSLLTTGLTYLSQSGLSVSDVIDKMTGNFDNFKKSLSEANKEAAKSAAEQVASVQSYVAIAKDRNLSDQERLIAVKKLQEEYPAYFGNLTKEQILTGNVGTALNEVVAALKAKARAQAYAGKLGELAAKEVGLREKEAELIEDSKNSLAKVSQYQKELSTNQFSESTFKAWQQSSRALKVYQDDLKDVKTEIRANSAEMDKWAKKSTIEVKASVKLDFKEEKIPKAKKVKDKTHAEFDTTFIAPFVSTISGLGDTMAGFEERTLKTFANATAIIKKELSAMELALIDFNNRANEIINGAIVDTFANLGSALGNALASGANVLEAVGLSLLDSLGGLLVQMGKMAIQVGVGLLAIKLALKSLNPAVAIGAGVALVALGSFFSSKSKSLAGGGGGGTSSSSGSGANNQSFTSNGFSGNTGGGGTVVFEIAGQKLIGVLSNTINGNKRLGGSLGF